MRTLEVSAQSVTIHRGELEEAELQDEMDFAYKIINIVALGILTLDKEGPINFDEFEKKVQVKRLNRFPCVMFKIDNISVILFKNGKLILTGIKNEEEILPLKEKISERLAIGGVNYSKFDIKIQNLVAMSQLSKIINLELACITLTNCLYEPEQFPAAIVKPPAGGTFLIFSNSKIIGLGMRNQEMLETNLRDLIQDIFDYDLFIGKTPTLFEIGDEFEDELF